MCTCRYDFKSQTMLSDCTDLMDCVRIGEWARVRPGVDSRGSGVSRSMDRANKARRTALATNGAECRRESRTTGVAPR